MTLKTFVQVWSNWHKLQLIILIVVMLPPGSLQGGHHLQGVVVGEAQPLVLALCNLRQLI